MPEYACIPCGVSVYRIAAAQEPLQGGWEPCCPDCGGPLVLWEPLIYEDRIIPAPLLPYVTDVPRPAGADSPTQPDLDVTALRDAVWITETAIRPRTWPLRDPGDDHQIGETSPPRW